VDNEIVVPMFPLEAIFLMRRVSEHIYNKGVTSDYDDGVQFIAYLQAHATVERLLKELENE
jgi:hypothetical protein